jgi:hypothetical protein
VHTGRRRGKSRGRILYWFRTPPGVRVGRAALDEDAIRLIEEHNPDVEFDWTRILKGQGAPDNKPVAPREAQARPQPRPPARPPEMPEPPAVSLAAEEVPVPASPSDTEDASAELVVVSEIPEAPAIPEAPTGIPEEPQTAAGARLGSEGLSRLRARHAEVLARISERIADPARRDELKSEADRLNPDTWVTDAEVTAGLEQYESAFEALRGVLGRPRRRRRRGRGPERPANGATDGTPSSVPDADDEDGPDEPGPAESF